MSQPRIAVVLCTHDGDRHVGEQLASIAAQSRLPVALFVHDWASGDATRAIVRDFARVRDREMPVVLVEHDRAPGPARSFIEAIRHCLGSPIDFDYLALCDQDDRWAPDKLERYAARIVEPGLPTPQLLHGDVRLVGPDGRLLAPSFYGPRSPFQVPRGLQDASLLLVNPVIGMTLCASRAFLESCGDDLDGHWLMHDWALALLAVARGASTAFVAEPTVDYRQHGRNALGAAQGWRLFERLRKARGHFARLRAQAASLSGSAAGGAGALPAHALRSRLAAARIARRSNLLKPRSRWLLAGAILVLW